MTPSCTKLDNTCDRCLRESFRLTEGLCPFCYYPIVETTAGRKEPKKTIVRRVEKQVWVNHCTTVETIY